MRAVLTGNLGKLTIGNAGLTRWQRFRKIEPDADTFVLRRDEPPKEVPPKFEQACLEHPDVHTS